MERPQVPMSPRILSQALGMRLSPSEPLAEANPGGTTDRIKIRRLKVSGRNTRLISDAHPLAEDVIYLQTYAASREEGKTRGDAFISRDISKNPEVDGGEAGKRKVSLSPR